MNQASEIQRIVEKSDQPPSNMINAGLYGFGNTKIFEYVEKVPLSSRGEYELTDALQMFIDDDGVISVIPVFCQDIGTKDEYERSGKTRE